MIVCKHVHITVPNAGKIVVWLVVPQRLQTFGYLCTKNKIHSDTNKKMRLNTCTKTDCKARSYIPSMR